MHITNQTRQAQEPEAIDPAAMMAARIVGAELAHLSTLREAGMSLVTELTGGVCTAPAPERALAFTRVARAVRQIVALEQELLSMRPVQGECEFGQRRLREARETAAAFAVSDDTDDDDLSDDQDLRDGNGLRDPNDLRERSDYDDYDHGAIEDVIAHVREVLGAEAARVLEADVASEEGKKVRVDAPIKSGHDGLRVRPKRGCDPPNE